MIPLPTLVDIARRHLGQRDNLYFAPDIPRAKEAAVRAVHAQHLAPHEPIGVLFDATLLGTAREGFVVTPQRFCWKETLAQPHYLPWEAVDPTAISVNGHGLVIHAGSLMLLGGEHRAAAMIRELATMAEAPGSPYRGGPEERDGSTRVLRAAHRFLGGAESVYIAPHIPRAKEIEARSAYCAGLDPSERLLVLWDGALMGAATIGFAITPRELFWRNRFQKTRVQCELAHLSAEEVERRSDHLVVRGRELNVDWMVLRPAWEFLRYLTTQTASDR